MERLKIDWSISDKTIEQQFEGAKDWLPNFVEHMTKNWDFDYKTDLWDADPNCEHELDPKCYSGVRCLKCSGWYCI